MSYFINHSNFEEFMLSLYVGLSQGKYLSPRPTTLAYDRAGPAVLAAVAGRVGCFFFIFSSRLSYLPFGRWLDILKYCGLGSYNPTVVASYYQRRARKVLVNCLVGLSLPRNNVIG